MRFVSSTGVRVYRIPCEVIPDLSARVHLLLGAGPPTLVDTGSGLGPSTRHILAGLETVRTEFGEPIGLADVRRILLSHGHVDHVGGLPELREGTGAAIGIHELDCRMVTAHHERSVLGARRLARFLDQAGVEPARRETLLRAYGLVKKDLPKIPVDFVLEDNGELDGLRLIHTPGHSPGHVCILAGDILLSGDHVLSQTIPQQWPESLNPYTGLGHYLDSLDKVRRLEGVRLTLGGHEAPIEDLAARVDEIRRLQLRRLDRVLAILRASGPLSINQLAQQMYPKADSYHGLLAIQDAAARVEYLHLRGRLVVANLDEAEAQATPVYCYQPA
jgi:glyoxylase-like metal-dependent hydrolase (beta-lactamase superfamily II)